MVSTTLPISWRTLRSRCGVPSGPRKYLDTTTLVASWDHVFGISTSRCSKTVSPDSPEITAERISHSTVSYGFVPLGTNRRGTERPFRGVLPSEDPCAPSSRPTGSIAIVIPPSGPFRAVPRILRCRRSYTTTSCAVKDFFQYRDGIVTRTPRSDGPARLGEVL